MSDPQAAEPAVRPVGTWVVAGFLLAASLIMWILVAVTAGLREREMFSAQNRIGLFVYDVPDEV